jgi:hypothetical protein
MRWRRERRETLAQNTERARKAAIAHALRPLTISPWRMRIAITAQYLAAHVTRAMLKGVSALVRFALVRKETR